MRQRERWRFRHIKSLNVTKNKRGISLDSFHYKCIDIERLFHLVAELFIDIE